MTPNSSPDINPVFGVSQPVAFVTGSAANRVGRCIARYFAERNYHVVLHAHRSVEQAEKVCEQWCSEGLSASYVTGAIDDAKCIDQWIETILHERGQLQVVVNSAAMWDPSTLEELDEEKLQSQWKVNLAGPTLLCRTAGLAMAKQKSGGAIINIGDWATIRPYRDFASYLLTKGSIRTLTEVMAVELALRNSSIRVNAVLPGPVLLDETIGQTERGHIIEQSLLKREGRPEDVAQAVFFLAESPFITGVCLPVDGGRTIFAGTSPDIAAHPTYKSN